MEKNKAAYFVSDAHFGANLHNFGEREELMFEFFAEIREEASHLFILGDLFDFWIEYRYSIRSDYFNVLHEMRKLVESGVDVYYIAGNHDFALGNFLTDVIGVNIEMDFLDINIQGKNIHLRHGDGIVRHDIFYNFMKSCLRNNFFQSVYKILHPDVAIPLGLYFSKLSRESGYDHFSRKAELEYFRAAERLLTDKNYNRDIVLMGHVHNPAIYRVGENKIYCNTGMWLGKYTYAKLEGGEVSLLNYRFGKENEAIDYTELT